MASCITFLIVDQLFPTYGLMKQILVVEVVEELDQELEGSLALLHHTIALQNVGADQHTESGVEAGTQCLYSRLMSQGFDRL